MPMLSNFKIVQFKTFFEEGIAQKRNGVPYGNIYNFNRDKDGNVIGFKIEKDVEEYKKRRADAFEPRITTDLGSITDNIRYDINNQIDAVMKYYGFSLKAGFDSLPRDGSLVYRGHKDPDPFSKSEDAKARGSSVYFSSNPEYTHGAYSVGYNLGSTQIGQTGFNSLQSTVSDPKSFSGWGPIGVGFFTVATPKNADKILWYSNYGYEKSGAEGYTRLQREIKDGWDFECVEPIESFSKIKTYLTYNKYMISFDRLKQVQPDLYNQVKNSYVIKSIKEPRAI